MSAATPAEIWYCFVQPGRDCRDLDDYPTYPTWHDNCGLKRLVDPLALVVERDAEGWQSEVVEVAAKAAYDFVYPNPDDDWEDEAVWGDMAGRFRDEARAVFDALAARREAST